MQKVPMPPPGFAELTVDEKIDYVQSLWDHIAALPDQIPVPAWHRELLEERRQAYGGSLSAPKQNWISEVPARARGMSASARD